MRSGDVYTQSHKERLYTREKIYAIITYIARALSFNDFFFTCLLVDFITTFFDSHQ
jgi:hypothetical protein